MTDEEKVIAKEKEKGKLLELLGSMDQSILIKELKKIAKGGRISLPESEIDLMVSKDFMKIYHGTEANKDDQKNEFQKNMDLAFMCAQVSKIPLMETDFYKMAMATGIHKELTTPVAGKGAEWIPQQFSSRFIEGISVLSGIMNAFEVFNIPEGIGTLEIATQDDQGISLRAVFAGDNIITQVQTKKVQLKPDAHAAYESVGDDFNMDSFMAQSGFIQKNLQQKLSRGFESSIYNSDTAGTHMDSDTTAANDVNKSTFNGLRSEAVDNSRVVVLAAFDSDKIQALRKRANMDRYGSRPSSIIYTVGIDAGIDLVNLRDVQNNRVLQTLNEAGPGATQLTGQIGQFYGTRVLTSEFVREDLTSAGIFDGVTTTHKQIMIINTESYAVGVKALGQIVTDPVAKRLATDIIASGRIDFKPLHDSTEKTNVLGLYV